MLSEDPYDMDLDEILYSQLLTVKELEMVRDYAARMISERRTKQNQERRNMFPEQARELDFS
tara:strand:- start:215 stop:400 length:186 start_codon:yes stop_codon:yes gene_type:complete